MKSAVLVPNEKTGLSSYYFDTIAGPITFLKLYDFSMCKKLLKDLAWKPVGYVERLSKDFKKVVTRANAKAVRVVEAVIRKFKSVFEKKGPDGITEEELKEVLIDVTETIEPGKGSLLFPEKK